MGLKNKKSKTEKNKNIKQKAKNKNVKKAKNKGINKNTHVSIQLNDYDCRVVLGNYNKKIKIKNFFTIEYGQKLIDDGEIQDFEKLRNVLKDGMSQIGVSGNDCTVTLNSSKTIVRFTEAPKVQEKLQGDVIQTIVRETLLVSEEEYDVQFAVQNEFLKEDTSMYGVTCYAVPKSIAETQYELIKAVGLKPKYMDITNNSTSKLLEYLFQNVKNDEYPMSERKNTNIALIDIAYNSINLNIYKKGVLAFQKSFDNGLSRVEDGLVESDYDITNIKEVSVYESNEEIYSVTRKLINDIEMNLKYFASKEVGGRIDNSINEIFFYGHVPNIINAEKDFERRVGVVCARICRLNGIILDNELSDEDISHYLNAIGALIRV